MTTNSGAAARSFASSGYSRPTATPFMKFAHWTRVGLSYPSALRVSSRSAGVQFLPQENCAASTGDAKNSRNVTRVITISMMMPAATRLTM